MRGDVTGMKFGLLTSLSALAIGMTASLVMAQVAPTEVNEPAVDEFGLERKTGRFSWSSHELISVGGDDAGLGVVVTGISDPAWTETKLPDGFPTVHVNGPTLSSYNLRDPSSPIINGEYQNRYKRTVDYFGGSETFESGFLGNVSEYWTESTLDNVSDGFIFTDNQGIKIHFSQAKSRVVFPDGREIAYEKGKFRKNNFGYMVKISGAMNYQAVNQAIDYCVENNFDACTALSSVRTASIVTSTTGTYSGSTTSVIGTTTLTDAAGGVTALRWAEKVAKLARRPQGSLQPAWNSTYIPTVRQRYLLGITLPGDALESITISYNSIDPTKDPHDDIRVTSIIKNGITANYEHIATYPYGFPEAPPEQNGGASFGPVTGIVVSGRLESKKIDAALRNSLTTCQGGNSSACPDIVGNSAAGWDLPASVLNYPAQQAPNDEPGLSGSSGNDQYYLHTKTTINGAFVNESFAVKPEGTFGRSRRRLLNVTDALGRNTDFHHSIREEFAGVIHPEGNESFNDYDQRGNISKVTVKPKPGSGLPVLFTLYTYPVECTPTAMATCNKPLTVTDPENNVTDYSYNSMGQVETETKPAPSVGAPRPKVTNSYTMRTAYIKDASGNPVAAGPPISLLTQTSSCITLSSCAGTTDEVVTTFDYGPTTGLNNLNLRGIAVTAANSSGLMETLRTCYRYNYFGEKIAETKPSGTGSVCP